MGYSYALTDEMHRVIMSLLIALATGKAGAQIDGAHSGSIPRQFPDKAGSARPLRTCVTAISAGNGSKLRPAIAVSVEVGPNGSRGIQVRFRHTLCEHRNSRLGMDAIR